MPFVSDIMNHAYYCYMLFWILKKTFKGAVSQDLILNNKDFHTHTPKKKQYLIKSKIQFVKGNFSFELFPLGNYKLHRMNGKQWSQTFY